MEIYQHYLNKIKSTYKSINGTKEKIAFLFNERNDFRQNNKNQSADSVVQWFTDEIEKLKLLMQVDQNQKVNNIISQNDISKTSTDQKEIQSPDTDLCETENDLILSTIEDWLFPFKDEGVINDSNYNTLVSSLCTYFKTDRFPTLNSPIKVHRVNKKRFGWALNEIFRSINDNNERLPIEYLMFAKRYISIFTDVSLDEDNFCQCNLYKYFTTKTL